MAQIIQMMDSNQLPFPWLLGSFVAFSLLYLNASTLLGLLNLAVLSVLSNSTLAHTHSPFQSELPFRMLCRENGATCAYTPMFHSRLFAQDPKYR